MKKRNLYLFTMMCLLSFVSCEKTHTGKVELNPEEVFEDSDAPIE